jgi:hypothetical protein
MKGNESAGTIQHTLRFFRDLQAVNPPLDAPSKYVRQCMAMPNPRTTAMRVSMQAAGLKQLACATKLDIHESYLSRLIAGTHNDTGEFPRWFVAAFCWATGSRLLEQVIEREQEEADEESPLLIERRMAAQLGVAA